MIMTENCPGLELCGHCNVETRLCKSRHYSDRALSVGTRPGVDWANTTTRLIMSAAAPPSSYRLSSHNERISALTQTSDICTPLLSTQPPLQLQYSVSGPDHITMSTDQNYQTVGMSLLEAWFHGGRQPSEYVS